MVHGQFTNKRPKWFDKFGPRGCVRRAKVRPSRHNQNRVAAPPV